MHAHVKGLVCKFMCVREHNIHVAVVPQEPSLQNRVFTLQLELTDWLEELARESQRFTCLCLPRARITRPVTRPAFYVGAGDRTQVVTLGWQHFTN